MSAGVQKETPVLTCSCAVMWRPRAVGAAGRVATGLAAGLLQPIFIFGCTMP